MTSIIKLEVLSGAYDEDPFAACYLLQVDEFRFLLDCGWDESFSMNFIRRVAKHAKSIDAVLISHSDIYHLGALPYLVGKCGLSCPIYATVPVSKMGEMFMYDLYTSRERYEDFKLFSLEDVDQAFSKIIQMKYNQTISLSGKGRGLKITPICAGQSIGGTIWKIIKDGEEEIIYAIDFNHKRERHLNGCTIESINKPSLLIIDAFNSMYAQSKRTTRDEELMTTILNTLKNGGNALVCVDTAGRSLELAYMLDTLWRSPKSELMAYSLAFLNSVSSHVIEFAKSQVEWMSDKIMKSFEDQRNNPFHMRCLKICQDRASLEAMLDPRIPRVVLASQPDLSLGFSRDLFIEYAEDARSSIILTQRSSSSTLASELLQLSENDRRIQVEIFEKIPLQGLELEHYKKDVLKKEEEKKRLAKQMEEEESDDEEEQADDGEDDDDGNKARRMFKTKKSYPMYPLIEVKVKWDDYGEIINPEDFILFDQSKMSLARDAEYKENQMNQVNDVLMAEPEEEKIPMKSVTELKSLNIRANVSFIDFEGRSDGESVKKIISMMKPRRVILVHGTPKSTDALETYCESIKSESFIDKVFKPKVGDIVDATTESHIYQVKLKDSLVSSLKFATSKDGIEVAWIDGQIELPEEESLLAQESEDQKDAEEIGQTVVETSETKESLATLGPLPSDAPGHVTIFINELKLSDFKQVLLRNGVQAEFSGGVLYCNNQSLAIRRNEAGRILIEGTLSENYFKIRELLYSQYAII